MPVPFPQIHAHSVLRVGTVRREQKSRDWGEEALPLQTCQLGFVCGTVLTVLCVDWCISELYVAYYWINNLPLVLPGFVKVKSNF